jgi:hypothetical protein
MTDKPSQAMMTVFAAILRRMPQPELLDLLARFVALDEHPKVIKAIEREISLRDKEAKEGSNETGLSA